MFGGGSNKYVFDCCCQGMRNIIDSIRQSTEISHKQSDEYAYFNLFMRVYSIFTCCYHRKESGRKLHFFDFK